jgi:hypothetical protein
MNVKLIMGRCALYGTASQLINANCPLKLHMFRAVLLTGEAKAGQA